MTEMELELDQVWALTNAYQPEHKANIKNAAGEAMRIIYRQLHTSVQKKTKTEAEQEEQRTKELERAHALWD